MSGIVNSTGAKSGIIGTTVGTPVAGDARLGKTCRMYLTSTISNSGPGILYMANYGMTTDYNEDTDLYLPVNGPSGGTGIKILVAGTYLFHWSIYTQDHNDSGGLMQEYLAVTVPSVSDTVIQQSYFIIGGVDLTYGWYKQNHVTVAQIAVNKYVNVMNNRSAGTRTIAAGQDGTFITATFLHD